MELLAFGNFGHLFTRQIRSWARTTIWGFDLKTLSLFVGTTIIIWKILSWHIKWENIDSKIRLIQRMLRRWPRLTKMLVCLMLSTLVTYCYHRSRRNVTLQDIKNQVKESIQTPPSLSVGELARAVDAAMD